MKDTATEHTPEATYHEPGIYFGLDEEEYHADPALGSTDIKGLVIDPVEWQFKRLHDEDKDPTPALIYGKGLHCRVLEGPDAFAANFYTKITANEFKKQHPETLATIDDLKEWLKSKGVEKPTGKKSDLVEQAMGIAGCPPLYDDYLAKIEPEGKTELTQDQFDRIQLAAEWMQTDHYSGQIMKNGTFDLGAAEVSIFCEINGIRRKARFDRLLGHAIVDVKTFAPQFQENIRESCIKAIERFRYDLQAAAYFQVWHAGRELWKQGKVFGQQYDGLLEKCYSEEEPIWIWMFIKSVGAPQPMALPFRTESETFKTADAEIKGAIASYKRLIAHYGVDVDWPPHHDAKPITDECFHAYFTNRRA